MEFSVNFRLTSTRFRQYVGGMPIRPNGFKNAPAAPKTKRRVDGGEGGTPIGWTFISTSYQCWLKWLYRYILGIYPAQVNENLLTGSAYHALLEGDSPEKVLKDFPEQAATAMSLYRARMEKGPPIPEAEVVEETVKIFGGTMSSKPDRVEKRSDGSIVARDYKTAMQLSEWDEQKWNVDGGILGELIAVNATKGIVDIQRKTGLAETKLVKVELTAAKSDALFNMVADFWNEVYRRLKSVAERRTSANAAFPRNLTGCVGKYGPCEYYNRCWGKAPESLLFRDTKKVGQWAKYRGKPYAKLAEAVAVQIRKAGVP